VRTDRRRASTSRSTSSCTPKTRSLFDPLQEDNAAKYSPSREIVAALPRDRWILTSLLQKAIRRGRVDYAVAAADTLVALEPDYVASRLPVIAYEDIGVADLPSLLWTKQVAATISAQTEVERRKVATAVAGRLADSPKSRTACDIMCLTDCSTEAKHYADELSRRGLAEWIDTATASTQPLIRRAVAWRFILGLSAGGKRPNISAGSGRKSALATVAEATQLPTELIAAIHAGTGTHNLHTALVLAYELVYSTPNAAIKRRNMLPVAGRVAGGVMLCALDMYTRAGRTAYRRVLASAPRLMAMLHRYAPRGDPVECVGMLMFHAEGSVLSGRVESPASLAVPVEVEFAEAMSAGFESTEGALKVRQWLRHHQQLIDATRAQLILSIQKASSAS
jgi:MgsA AAA+ ATPase C terminal